ncbi:hypothetical protein CYMTET_11562 [Cymbomonas tetramitiformis]|uniref:MATH domain-containing protein n=1 Tax=Cymbomonas tetramitiformis TaxID=36881 RepID=A0AAE0GM81_9CHLO|nr:hypothetical protein CYMTET_11562 [Cymbomonas tetramitiformis]
MAHLTSHTASRTQTELLVGTHVHTLNGFSNVSGFGRCRRLSSDSFHVGGFEWRIDCYPNGIKEKYADYLSVFLMLHGPPLPEDMKISAFHEIAIVDQSGKGEHLVASSSSADGPQKVKGGCLAAYKKFAKREVLQERRAELLRDDRLIIRCTIEVLVSSTDRTLPVPMFAPSYPTYFPPPRQVPYHNAIPPYSALSSLTGPYGSVQPHSHSRYVSNQCLTRPSLPLRRHFLPEESLPAGFSMSHSAYQPIHPRVTPQEDIRVLPVRHSYEPYPHSYDPYPHAASSNAFYNAGGYTNLSPSSHYYMPSELFTSARLVPTRVFEQGKDKL